MGLVAPRHVGSSRTRARTHIPCIGRWILNHWATREVPATSVSDPGGRWLSDGFAETRNTVRESLGEDGFKWRKYEEPKGIPGGSIQQVDGYKGLKHR